MDNRMESDSGIIKNEAEEEPEMDLLDDKYIYNYIQTTIGYFI